MSLLSLEDRLLVARLEGNFQSMNRLAAAANADRAILMDGLKAILTLAVDAAAGAVSATVIVASIEATLKKLAAEAEKGMRELEADAK